MTRGTNTVTTATHPSPSGVAGRLLSRPPLLEIRDVVVRFGGLKAVDVEQLTIREDRIVGLVGANGAGKTTLFDVISGFVTPESGSLVYSGEPDLLASHAPPGLRSRLGIGRSFQNATLFQSLTVAETLAVAFERRLQGQGMVSAGLGMPWIRRVERRVHDRVEELVERLGLGAFHDKFISELSTGSRRIVDIACVMAHRPRLLLLDEPSSGIAQREVEALETLLRRVKDELGCTLVVVEHDIPLIRSMADELYALEVGKVIAHGTPEEVLSDPAVIRAYLGTDPRAVERSGAASVERTSTGSPGDQVDDRERNLDDLTVAELRALAKELDVPGRSGLRRAELLEAVRGARADQEGRA